MADMATDKAQTWHHGVVAEWWDEFARGGPEIASFGRFVEAGRPALDAGCGTGRLLLPWLDAGYDVDGCDVSADMVDLCRARAQAAGHEPTLFVTPLHELDPPRRYRTIVACGVFGLGTTMSEDAEGLSRLRRALEPGGLLVLDHEAPYANERLWNLWTRSGRATLPEPWPSPDERQAAPGEREFALTSRAVAADPVDQSVILEIQAQKWMAGHEVASEVHRISIRSYPMEQLLLLLERAGFSDVRVRGGYADDAPTPEHDFLVYVARA